MRIQAFALALALAFSSIGAARAIEVQFTITGGGHTTAFQLDPTLSYGVPGVFVFFPSVPVTVGGSPATPTSVTFWNEGLGGGFVSMSNGFLFTEAPQLYSGSENSPTFIPTSYELFNYMTLKTDTVTVTDLLGVTGPPDPPDPPTVAAPELSTWAMLLLGFAGLSFAGYRKATRTLN